MVFSALRFTALFVAVLPFVSASLERRALRSGPHPHFEARGTAGKCIASSWAQIGEREFDYVIAGGGTAGLALAGRLSEDADVTVAVIEAGHASYGAQEARILSPSAAYFDSSVGSELDWQYKTTLQAGTGREMSWPRGKTLGGSSAINGLYYTQASVREHQAWSRLATGSDNDTEHWGWHAMRDAHRKSTEYMGSSVRELDGSIAAQANDTLGHHGPLAVAYPARSYSSVAAWGPAFASMGINAAAAPYDGQTHGAFVAASTLDTAAWTRSFSRSAYVDPICDKRANLVILPNQHVTKVIFDDADDTEGPRRALGVEFAASKQAPRVQVTARREVILSAGAIGSAQLLQLSGVGRKELLQKHGIDVVYDLPGVGHNLQDHLAVSTSSKAKAGVPLPSNSSTADKQLNSYVDGAVAYLTVRDLFGNDTAAFLQRAEAASTKYAAASKMPAAVQRGYRRQVRLLLRDLLADESQSGFAGHAKPVLEMLLGTMGASINFESAMQAPFSRGAVSIASADAFAAPTIDAGYLGHDTDLELLVAGIKIARRTAATPQYAELIDSETLPGASVATESYEQLIKYVRDSAQTNYHPTSTCSMLAEHLGGVVDKHLRVYGTANLRVADASVIPVSLSSHTQSTAYAIAERAADILKQDRKEGRSEPVEECEEEDEEEGDDDDEEDCEA